MFDLNNLKIKNNLTWMLGFRSVFLQDVTQGIGSQDEVGVVVQADKVEEK